VAEPWNHNIHYHRLVLGAVPPGALKVLRAGPAPLTLVSLGACSSGLVPSAYVSQTKETGNAS
jgi:hypothetical protein